MIRRTLLPPAPQAWRASHAPAGVLLFVAVLAAVVAFLVHGGGCAGWQAPPVVSIAGTATNAATRVLVALEEEQGSAEIAAGRDPEVTVVPRWAPFWAAWGAWVVAQHAWASAYDRGAPELAQAEEAARAAFCAAKAAMPDGVPPEVIAGIGLACVLLPRAPAVLPIIALDAGDAGGSDAR